MCVCVCVCTRVCVCVCVCVECSGTSITGPLYVAATLIHCSHKFGLHTALVQHFNRAKSFFTFDLTKINLAYMYNVVAIECTLCSTFGLFSYYLPFLDPGGVKVHGDGARGVL